jgi:hypothetical protein
MNILKLLRERDAGLVKITFTKNYNYDLKEVMSRVGLRGGPSDLRRIDREESIETMAEILGRDLAYHHELIDKKQARQSALEFISEYALANAELYSDPSAWFPVSTSTFDLCLVIVNSDSAVCALAEDED